MVLSETVLCTAVKHNQQEMQVAQSLSGSHFELNIQGQQLFFWHRVMNASCWGLMFGNRLTERGENVKNYSSWVVLLQPIIKQTGAPSANQQQAQLSSSQSSNMESSEHSKQGCTVCKQLGGSSFHQNSWYFCPQITNTQCVCVHRILWKHLGK